MNNKGVACLQSFPLVNILSVILPIVYLNILPFLIYRVFQISNLTGVVSFKYLNFLVSFHLIAL
jgi:hypothetical protein